MKGVANRFRSSRALLAGATALFLVACAGCSSPESLASRYGDGADALGQHEVLTEIAPDDRGAQVSFTAPLVVGGGTASPEDYAGQILFINLWYAGCVPCRTEAPELATLARSAPGSVAVLGVNNVDTDAVANRFIDEYDLPYPNVLDARGAPARTGLQASITANATPTTVVLDRQGRVAGRVLGAVTSDQLDALAREAARLD